MFSISVPLPSFDGDTVKALKKILTGMEEASEEGPVRGGVVSEGDAAAYALVWEYGNARQTKKGPKTVRGENPDGESVWLSIQAPAGYIRVNEAEYIRIIEDQLGAMDLGNLETGKDIRKAMTAASAKSAELIAEVIKQFVPVDSGALRESIGPADPDDPELAEDDMDMELGEPTFVHKGLQRALKQLVKRIK